MKNMNFPSLHKRLSGFRVTGLLTLSLVLAACQAPVFVKPGGEALKAGDAVILNNGPLADAEAAYREALTSPYPEIRGAAAYNLSLLAQKRGNTLDAHKFLEQAVQDGHMQAKLALADLYKRQGSSHALEVDTLSRSLADTSAAANINLLEAAHLKRNAAEAKNYAVQAETLIKDQMARNGDIDGSKALMLARLYTQHGKYFDSPRDADPLYRSAIAKGNVKAAEELAEVWLADEPKKHSYEDIFSLMVQAAKAGNNNAIKYVASAYEEGLGVAKDPAKAMEWYEKVQGGMKLGSIMRLAHASIAKDPAKAIVYFKEAAAKGSLEAHMMLTGLQKQDAAPELKKAAGNNPDSLFSVAKDMDKLYGETHPEMVNHLYLIAAECGSGKAALRTAQNFEKNSGNSQNSEVYTWYKKAAELGSGKAMLRLARIARVGGQNGVPNEADTFLWFEKAAKADEAEGQYETGLAYARGTGTEKNMDKAKYWLEKAQAGGYILAIDVLKTINSDQHEELKQ